MASPNKNKSTKKTTETKLTKDTKVVAAKKLSTKKAPQNKKKSTKKSEKPNYYEIKLLGLIAFTVLSIASLHTESAGAVGLFVKELYLGLFSFTGYFLPYMIFGIIFITLNKNLTNVRVRYLTSITLGFISLVLMISIFGRDYIPKNILTKEGLNIAYELGLKGLGGGAIGGSLTRILLDSIGLSGVYIIILSMILLVMLLCTKMTITKLMTILKGQAVKTGETIIEVNRNVVDTLTVDNDVKTQIKKRSLLNLTSQENFDDFEQPKTESKPDIAVESKEKDIKIIDFNHSKKIQVDKADDKPVEPAIQFAEDTIPVKETVTSKETQKVEDNKGPKKEVEKELTTTEKNEIENTIESNVEKEFENYIIPSTTLLKENKQIGSEKDRKDILIKARLLEDTLNNFGVDAKVVQISKGPTITRFEIQPSPGVKVSKIVNLSDDIALNLAAHQVRIVAPIPGKAAVGIEVPNKTTSIVTLREVLETDDFKKEDSKLTFGLGKDISGAPILADLSKMPHLLVAGATGSGKSVCVNTMISSILCNSKPDEVKFLMIDPKVVELNVYNGIPHLILPVVTDPKKASVALNWAVQEMTDRYNRFAQASVRDVSGYNKKVDEFGEGKKMPRIVVIIDELADLMMVAPNAVEDAICRLAQMARAAGIHLIVATQRPSVDVITGVIKANIPSRIAFAVSSQIDSRTIIDMAGAEKLLGKGDMLYYPVGSSKPQRVQGSFISETEVEKVVEAVKNQVEPVEYSEEILDNVKQNFEKKEDADEYLVRAIELVIDAEQASVSMLQRKFRIGYNRAARLIDELEERGIVGPTLGSKPRNVLMTRAEYENLSTEMNE